MDWFLMVTFFLCLITGFFIIIPSSEALGIFWLVVSCVTYLPTLYLPCYCKHNPYMQLETAEGGTIQLSVNHIYAKKQKLAWVLTIILPLYTVNYLVALGGAINPAQTIAIYQILSVLTKGFFASITMVHYNYSSPPTTVYAYTVYDLTNTYNIGHPPGTVGERSQGSL